MTDPSSVQPNCSTSCPPLSDLFEVWTDPRPARCHSLCAGSGRGGGAAGAAALSDPVGDREYGEVANVFGECAWFGGTWYGTPPWWTEHSDRTMKDPQNPTPGVEHWHR